MGSCSVDSPTEQKAKDPRPGLLEPDKRVGSKAEFLLTLLLLEKNPQIASKSPGAVRLL